jgi:hypothetical protein
MKAAFVAATPTLGEHIIHSGFIGPGAFFLLSDPCIIQRTFPRQHLGHEIQGFHAPAFLLALASPRLHVYGKPHEQDMIEETRRGV